MNATALSEFAQHWLTAWNNHDVEAVLGHFADDVVFRSPAVFAPQEGKDLAALYLRSAMAVLGPSLRYVGEWYGPSSAVLEFEAELDGLYVHGVDMLRWNDDDRLVSFTVMVRPMRGLTKLVELMQRQLTGNTA